MPAMTLDNATICRHFFVGMAHSYGIVATNLKAVTLERGTREWKCAIPQFFSVASHKTLAAGLQTPARFGANSITVCPRGHSIGGQQKDVAHPCMIIF